MELPDQGRMPSRTALEKRKGVMIPTTPCSHKLQKSIICSHEARDQGQKRLISRAIIIVQGYMELQFPTIPAPSTS
jgi:hypothetical protein